jgi:Leucine Rich repeat
MGCMFVCLPVNTTPAQVTEDASQRDRVIALVERLGGQIERDAKAPGDPVVGIRLATTRISDEQLGELQGLSSLRSLDLTQTRISDTGLAHLRGHEGLRSLILFDTRVTDRGFASIATISGLETLVAGMCDVTGAGLSQLESLNHLKSLTLMGLEVTDETLAPVARLTRLEVLSLFDLKITDSGLAHLRGLTRLRRLSLGRNFHGESAITDAGLAHLAGLADLEELGLENTRVTDAGLIPLKGLRNLKRIRHAGTAITAAGLSQLAHLEPDRARATAGAALPKSVEPGSGPGGIVAPVEVTLAQVRSAVARAVPPLQKSLVVYEEKRDCFSCHNQGVPLVALQIARSRGLAIDEDAFQGAVALTLADLEPALERYRKGQGQAGGADRAAYALWALEAGDHPPDEITTAVTEFLLKVDRDREHWTSVGGSRVPIEGSPFTVTALALRGLQTFAPNARAELVANRVAQARSWLTKSQPADTEGRAFRLWGLKYAAASPEAIAAAEQDLLAAQRGDGGWAQIDSLVSDAYATGSALVALHQAGRLSTDNPAYRRGVAFLWRTQKDDGTWFVASRSRAFQLYFESGFPYGKDQFIAVAASGWAAAALALALPPAR